MASWRGKRAATWMTGVLAFAVSIGTAFTGYLSQQNFDSQWIGTQAKDGLNSVGVGAFFNVLNFGQMLLWHVLLLPLVVAVLVGLHLLLVRRRGVVRPMPLHAGAAHRASPDAGPPPATPPPPWRSSREHDRAAGDPRPGLGRGARPADTEWTAPPSAYDLVKEFVVALVVIVLLVVGLSVVLSSPDVRPLTIRQWSQADASDFLATAVSELDGSSDTATYGPPYNAWAPGEGQEIFHVGVERWVGVHVPVDTAHDFVLSPLRLAAADDGALRGALDRYDAASASRQAAWTAAYTKGLAHVSVRGAPCRCRPAATARSLP